MVILRNLKSILRTYNTSALVNLAGLAVALAAFMLILMQVSFEYGYDKFRPAHDRIYRVERYIDWGYAEGFACSISRPDAERFGTLSPHIESAGIVRGAGPIKVACADAAGRESEFQYQIGYVTPSLPETFQIEIVQGAGLTDDLSGVLIPLSMARMMFGRADPIGQRLRTVGEYFSLTGQSEFHVRGVYRDIPGNSMIGNTFLANEGDTEIDKPNWRNHTLYVRLDSPGAKETVEDLIAEAGALSDLQKERPEVRLTLLSDVYFGQNPFDTTTGNPGVTRIFVLIAVLILCIALINHFNFSIALVPLRIRSINVQKVLGASSGKLRAGLVAESSLYVVLAYLIAIWGVLLIQKVSPISYLQQTTTVADNPLLLLWGVLIAAGAGALCGLYPAFYATRIPPALALKGSFGQSFSGRRLRTLLVGFQFAVSIALIIAGTFMNMQYRLLRHTDLGFDRDQLIVLPVSNKLFEQRQALTSLLRTSPDIKGTGYSDQPFFKAWRSHWGILRADGSNVELDYQQVDPSFPSLMGLKVYEGRNFEPSDELREAQSMPVLANRTAQQAYGLKVGDVVGHIEIVGFVEDFNYKPLHMETEPLVLTTGKFSASAGACVFIKVNGHDYARILEFIRETARSLDSDSDGEPYFMDQQIDTQYRSDRQRVTLVTSYSLLAILISLSGAFSMMVLETRYKRKQTGIRRVFGASVPEILGLFSRPLAVTVLVCFAVAAPVAWYATGQWLQGYVVRTPMHWWVFALALLSVMAVTVTTVVLQSYRTATENPVKALKSE